MAQHLNLLPEKKRDLDPLLVAILVWGIVLAIIAGIWATNSVRIKALRQQEVVVKQKLAQTEALLQNRLNERGAELQAQIDVLRQRAEIASQLLARAETLGSHKGFAPMFKAVSEFADERLWLNAIKVAGAGRALTLDGRTLEKSLVLDYVQHVNSVIPADAKKLSTVELSAESPIKSPDGRLNEVTKFSLR